MGGIDFISSDKEKKKSRKRDFDSDIEYSTGEKLDAPSDKKKSSQQKPKHEKIKKEKERSFLHWRQEKERAKERKQVVHQAPKHEQNEDTPDLIHSISTENLTQAEPVLTDVPKITFDDEQAPDLLEDLQKLQKKVAKEQASKQESELAPDLVEDLHKPIEDLGEHEAPVHHREYAEADLLDAAKRKFDVGEHEVKQRIGEDEAPDMLKARAGKSAPAKPSKKDKGIHKPINGRQKKDKGAPRSLGVNLIPDEVLMELHSRSRVRDLALSGVGFVAVIMGVYAAMNVYQRKINLDTADLEKQIEIIEQEIISYEELQSTVKNTSGQLEGVAEVLEKHIYWTPFLGVVEELTLPTVYYTSMTGSAVSGEFTFSAVATDFNQIEAQVQVMERSDYVQSVSTNSATLYQADSIVGEEVDVAASEQAVEEIIADVMSEVADEAEAEVVETEAVALTPALVGFSLTIDFSPEVFKRISTGL